MSAQNRSLNLFFNLAKVQAIMNRRFDNNLDGLGFNEFMILFHLNQSPDNKLSRIDLSEKLGLTASGITRILLPMEKIGLVKKEVHAHDARISLVLLASGGKRRFTETLDRAEYLVDTMLNSIKSQKIVEITNFLTELGNRALIR